MQQRDLDALFVVREGTVLPIVTLLQLVWEEQTELDLVPIVVIQLFYLVVGLETLLLGRTLVSLVLAQFRRVGYFLE